MNFSRTSWIILISVAAVLLVSVTVISVSGKDAQQRPADRVQVAIEDSKDVEEEKATNEVAVKGQTVATAAKTTPGGTVSSNDVWVLSKIISGEARGEPYIGQVAVGAVIVNRVKNPNFPNSVWGVVFEPGAFDAVSDGQYYMEPKAESVKAARAAINGWDPSGGALYYWNPATATSKWIWSRKIINRIGKHVFGL